MRRTLLLSMILAVAVGANVAKATPEPGITLYHVGFDNSPIEDFGPFIGLENPNHLRLTMLWTHTFVDTPQRNHFHWIGRYDYTGSPDNPQPGFSSNNTIPEPYQGDDGLALLAGSGVFAGKKISGLGAQEFPDDEIEQEYAALGIYPMDELFQYDNQPGDDRSEFHPGHYLLNTLNGRFKESVADVSVGMELVDITPGLAIHDETGTLLTDTVGDVIPMGPGVDWSFEPVFAVDKSVPLGESYQATFILKDLGSTGYGDSAEFTFNFITVPEPSTALLGLTLLLGVAVRRR